MQKLGFKVIDALEPSKGMLDRAIEKGVYRKCIRDAIGSKPLDIPAGELLMWISLNLDHNGCCCFSQKI